MLFKKKKIITRIHLNQVKDAILENYAVKFPVKSIRLQFEYEQKSLSSLINKLNEIQFNSLKDQELNFAIKLKEKIVKNTTEFLFLLKFPQNIFEYSSFVKQTINLIEHLQSRIDSAINHLMNYAETEETVKKINIKINSFIDIISEFSKELRNMKIDIIDDITKNIDLIQDYKNKVNELNLKKDNLLTNLNKVSILRDKTVFRLNQMRIPKHLKNILESRKKLINDQQELTNKMHKTVLSILEKLNTLDNIDIRTKIESSFKDKNYKKIQTLIEDQDSLKEEQEDLKISLFNLNIVETKLKEISIQLNNNITYLEMHEQESAFNSWNQKVNELKKELKKINDALSDISVEFLKQKINKMLKSLIPEFELIQTKE